MRTIAICALCAAFSGCATTVPVVEELVKCDAPADMLAACVNPADIKQGITFGEMIDVSSRDRASLKACANSHKYLADVVAQCNASIDKNNVRIREINARSDAKR
jgi:hypothetical protein